MATVRQWSWKPGSRFNVAADVVGCVLQELEEANGVIRPTDFVEISRPVRSPTHRIFTWDDKEAAERHRESQARKAISCVRVTIKKSERETTGPLIAWVHIAQTVNGHGGQQGYINSQRVSQDEIMRATALADAQRFLRGFRNRYAHLQQLQGVFAAIDQMEDDEE